MHDPSNGRMKSFSLKLRFFTNFSTVGEYDVQLQASLKNYPSVKTLIPFKVFVMYPCSHLHDNHPDGFWMDKLISDMAVFIDGPSQSFYGNIMLLRCEYIKFLHGLNGEAVSKT